MSFTIISQRWFPEYAIARVQDGAKRSYDELSRQLLMVANALVPVDTGELESTGTASFDETGGAVSYNTPYAIVLHANPGWDFQGGRDGHWLEDALYQFPPVAASVFRDEMIKALA